ncbi:MAG: dipeptide epimerase [Bacteroidales bacterium]|nr:dipeptide epimerase [Bacteroidales bacterium]MDD2571326.1 dipeptide epimerase [Bacteroidales bacterium]MDD2812344.1 dipeptide epimerase [Bacteroidales bacterium]MDD3385864.1 dipeptide epimerase [Bacteroidales bacterium]MDD3870852.1 dipeptide epimerase [Bacteroidales bacterium]
MKTSRRSFLATSAVAATAFSVFPGLTVAGKTIPHLPASRMKLSFEPFNLALKHQFTLSGSSRSTTPVMLIKIDYEGITGYGEASMPPYLGESHQTASEFLAQVDLTQFNSPFLIEEVRDYLEQLAPGNPAAKASIDIALHDLTGKLMGQPWHKIWGLDPGKTPNTSFTIGIDTPEVVKAKTREASAYKILKVKIGRDNDREMIQAVRFISQVPIGVDVNQGWTDRDKALELIFWLKEQGVILIEQPMPKDRIEDNAWLTERSPLPIYGDEAIQHLPDVVRFQGVYHGINIKLMKCGGMSEAFLMAQTAKSLGMKVMFGCMTETSCAISAAAQLSPMAETADLDGNLLITNDPFTGVEIKNGKIALNDFPGIGVKKIV